MLFNKFTSSHLAYALQLGFTIAVAAIYFYPVFSFQLFYTHHVAYALARGAGSALKHLLPIIFIPTLRMFHKAYYPFVQKFSNVPLLGKLFHNRYVFHKMLGMAILALAFCHTASHIINHSVLFLAQESMTGMIMLACMTLPIAAMYIIRSLKSLAPVRQKMSYYAQFLLPHQLGWWGLVTAFAVHTTDLRLLGWSVVMFGLFSVDRLWEWYASRNVSVMKVEKIHDKMIIIETTKPAGFKHKAGEKAYLAYPPGNAVVNDVHPFTIASSPDEPMLRFVISDSGKWSHDLINRIEKEHLIRVSPAFPSLLDSSVKEPHSPRLFITSGSGLAVTLAHLHDKEDKSPISIIHSTRQREELALFNRYIKDKKLDVKAVNYFDTSGTYHSKLRQRNAPLNVTASTGRFVSSNNALLHQFKGRVIFCGNNEAGKDLEKTLANDPHKTLYKEKFDF